MVLKKREILEKGFLSIYKIYQSKLIDGGSAQGNNDLSPSVFKKVIQ